MISWRGWLKDASRHSCPFEQCLHAGKGSVCVCVSICESLGSGRCERRTSGGRAYLSYSDSANGCLFAECDVCAEGGRLCPFLSFRVYCVFSLLSLRQTKEIERKKGWEVGGVSTFDPQSAIIGVYLSDDFSILSLFFLSCRLPGENFIVGSIVVASLATSVPTPPFRRQKAKCEDLLPTHHLPGASFLLYSCVAKDGHPHH